MNKKTYSTPEVEIEKFLIENEIVTLSDGNGNLDDKDNNFGGANNGNGDWEF